MKLESNKEYMGNLSLQTLKILKYVGFLCVDFKNQLTQNALTQ